MRVSVILPAYNEEAGVGQTVLDVPRATLLAMGWDTEIIVVDNASTDATARVARAAGALVVSEHRPGYGNAIRAGYAVASGDVLATADADHTYPLDALPHLLGLMRTFGLQFITTNRYAPFVNGTFSARSRVGTWALTVAGRALGGPPVRDSQSGMWIANSALLQTVALTSEGMEFSQEIKAKAIRAAGRAWAEVPIAYRERVGLSKLNPVRDGWRCLTALAVRR